uniref:protein-tyrosine-phosphatase n=1 Tax=Stegastes partitus TaxID=144197 RepID=A0A3B5A4S2_9TELE
MLLVDPGLFIGTAADLNDSQALTNAGVSHILSVDSADPGPLLPADGGFCRKWINVLDDVTSDLLSHMDDCFLFIQEAVDGGRAALVHCQAGRSRSAAIVTAYLMKKHQLGFTDAYHRLKSFKQDTVKHSRTGLTHKQKHTQTHTLPPLCCYCLCCVVLFCLPCLNCTCLHYLFLYCTTVSIFLFLFLFYFIFFCLILSYLFALHSLHYHFALDSLISLCAVHINLNFLLCRRTLFRDSSILSHPVGEGASAFSHKKSSNLTGDVQCTSYFIEPVQWMEQALLGVMDGQLLCPKCSSKLGSFSWCGDQCSCGRWVTPAFQLHRNRVDEIRQLNIQK